MLIYSPQIFVYSFSKESFLDNKGLVIENVVQSNTVISNFLSGQVLNGISLSPIAEAAVIAYDAQKKPISTVMTDRNGNFLMYLPDDVQYMLEYFHEDFNIRYKKIEKINSKFPDFINLYLDPGVGIEIFMIEEKLDLSIIPHYIINSKYVLDVNNIYFDEDEYNLKPEFFIVLNEVIKILKENQALKVQVTAHTSSGADQAFSMNLSEKRARKIYDYLLQKDVNPKQIKYKGMGSTEPLIHNFEAKQKYKRDANRRIEFRILFE